jgi:hypothetical protein
MKLDNFLIEKIEGDYKGELLIKKKITVKKGKETRIYDPANYFKNDHQALEVYDEKRHKYVKLFLDIDINKKLSEYSKAQIIEKGKALVDFYMKTNEWYIINFSRVIEDEFKFSFHLIHKNIAFTKIKDMIRYIKEKYSHYEGLDIMQKPYFCLRGPLQSKWINDKDKKIGCLKNCTIVQSLITINFRGYHYLEYPKELEISKIPVDITYDKKINLPIIEKILDNLPAKYYDRYENWRNVGFALKSTKSHQRELFDLFISFSKKSNKFNFSDCNKFWYREERNEANNISMGSLYHYLKTERPDIYNNILYPINHKNKLQSKSGLTYQKFTRKWNNRKVKDTMDFIHDLRQVMGYCDHGNFVYIYKNKGGKIITSKEHTLNKYSLIVNGKRTSFHNILVGHGLQQIQYDDIVFNPNPKNVDEFDFNLWAGFKAEEKQNDDLIKPFLKHIKEVWADNDEERYNYIISWIANIIQKPDEKNGTVLVLIGAQGCGKSMITNFIGEKIIGEQYSTTIEKLERLTGRFNSILERKLLVTMDEVSNVKKDYHKTFDILKNLITETKRQIEKKYLEPITINDYCNYIMLSNNYYPVKIEGRDRRYAIFECSDKYVGNEKYFDKLNDLLTDDLANALFHYFKNYDISKVSIKKLPKSKLKDELMERSLPNIVIFLRDYINTLTKSDNDILNKNLWEEFKEWSINNNIKSGSSRVFSKSLSPYLEKKRKKFNGKYEFFYKINKDEFISIINKKIGFNIF